MRGGVGFNSVVRGGGPGVWAGQKQAINMPMSQLLPRLGEVLGPHKRALIISLVTVMASSLLQVLPPALTKHVIDVVIPARDGVALTVVVLVLLAAHAGRYALLYSNRIAMAIACQELVYGMAKQVFEHIQRLSLKFYERQGTGDIITRTTSDVNVLQQALQGGIVQALVGLLSMVAYGVTLLFLDWQLALVVFVTVPFMAVASYYSSEMLRERYLRVQERISAVNSVLAENITGVRVAKAFAREAASSARFDDRNKDNFDANMSTATVQAITGPSIQFIGVVAAGAVLLIGAERVINGDLTTGALFTFAIYTSMFFTPVDELIRTNATVQQGLAAAARIFEFIDERSDVIDHVGALTLGSDKPVEGRVTFDDVWFSYNPNQPVLRGVSLDAPPGTLVALVGHTGAGKTSMANLIPRFYDVDSGHVRIDGHDVRDLSLHSVREHVGLVLQETFLFGSTVRENIRYGRLEATDAEVEAAAREAHAEQFILDLPNGFETNVGDAGSLLSRGQRQRLSLARAILKDPKVLILDEATSDVDTETELLIQEALDRVMRGRTVFVIAHRLSTIRKADIICVMEQGVMVEKGRHDELLALGGRYHALYNSQFRKQEVPAATS